MSEKLGRPIPVLEAVTATGPSAVVARMRDGDGCRVNIVGSGGADFTVQVEGSWNEDDWYELGPALVIAADGVTTIWLPEPNTFVRVNVTAYVAGTVDANVQIYG